MLSKSYIASLIGKTIVRLLMHLAQLKALIKQKVVDVLEGTTPAY
jgi:hypothetical protein